MNPQLASMAIQFLKRANLTGAEVPAFLAVVEALNAIASPAPAAVEGAQTP